MCDQKPGGHKGKYEQDNKVFLEIEEFFIGPESDHWLDACHSLTDSVTDSITFSRLDGCE